MTAANFIYAGCQWGLLAALAKLGTPETVGRFGIGLALSAPVVMFFGMDLHKVLATDTSKDFSFHGYLSLRLATNTLALLFLCPIAIPFVASFHAWLAVVLVGLSKVIEATGHIFLASFQRLERLDLSARSLCIKGLLSVVAMPAVFALTRSLPWALVALCTAYLLTTLTYDLPQYARLASHVRHGLPTATPVSHSLLRSLPGATAIARTAAPLAVATLLMSLLTNVPRYAVAYSLGDAHLGIFVSISYVIVIGSKVIAALAAAALPRLATLHTAHDRRGYTRILSRMLTLCVLVSVLLLTMGALAGETTLRILYGPEYAKETTLLLWILLGGAFEYTGAVLWHALTAIRYIRIQIPLSAFHLVSAVALCYHFVPTGGLLGAAYALVLSGVLQTFANGLVQLYALHQMQNSHNDSPESI